MKKNWLVGIVAVLVLVLATAIVIAANPGTEADPLISKSYIETVLKPEIYAYIEQESNQGFTVVNVSAGKTVVCDAGAEVILRMGQATVIGSDRGGLADVTQGLDLADGTVVPANHMLIVPLGDGRGVKINKSTGAILMIKGGYTIK